MGSRIWDPGYGLGADSNQATRVQGEGVDKNQATRVQGEGLDRNQATRVQGEVAEACLASTSQLFS